MSPPNWYLELATREREAAPDLQKIKKAELSGRAAALHGTIITSAVEFVNRNRRYAIKQTLAYIDGYDSVAGTEDEMALRAARYSGYQRKHNNLPLTDDVLRQDRMYSDAQISAFREGEEKLGTYVRHNESNGPRISLKPVFAYLFPNLNVVNNTVAMQPAEPMQIPGAQNHPMQNQPMQNQPINFNNTLLPSFQSLLNRLPPPPAPNLFYIAGYNYGKLGIPRPDFITIFPNFSPQELSEFGNGFMQALLEANVLAQTQFAPAFRM